MEKPRFVLNLCGTSLLTNIAGEFRSLVNKRANAPDAAMVPEDDRSKIQRVIDEATRKVGESDLAEARKMSAEINSLAAYYGGDFSRAASDQHYLIHTDTWLGKAAAECVRDALVHHGVANVQLQSFGGLRTDSMMNFRTALGEMARWCEVNIPKQGMHVVFNLNGGFKSVQGFMQTLGLFYADERIYLFEGSNELLRIPRLPVRLDVAEDVRRHLTPLRRLALGLPSDEEIPDLYVLDVDGERTLSEWGELIWQQKKPDIYKEGLLPEISDKFHFTEQFRKDVECLSPNRKKIINERMDDLALCLESGKALKSLSLKQLSGDPKQGCTHECYAWSDQDAKRIYGYFDSSGVFVIDHLGKHL